MPVFFCSTQCQRLMLYSTITMLRLATVHQCSHTLHTYCFVVHILHVYPSLVCSGLIQSTWTAPPQRRHKACTVPIISVHSLQVRQYTHFLKFFLKFFSTYFSSFLKSSSHFKCVLTGHVPFVHSYHLSFGFSG